MKPKGILLTKELRQAFRDGRKTQSRRIIKPQPLTKKSVLMQLRESTCNKENKKAGYYYWAEDYNPMHDKTKTDYFKPEYQIGQRIYLKEPYQVSLDFYEARLVEGKYADDDAEFSICLSPREHTLFNNRKKPYMKTSARFMYASLARSLATITGVKVELVQDITTEDAIAEGIDEDSIEYKVGQFEKLWNSTYGDGAWERNDYVFVYTWEFDND